MNLYALIEYGKVSQLEESETKPPSVSATASWVDVTGNTEVRVGWTATLNGVWTFTAPSEQDLRNDAQEKKWELLNGATMWLMLNSLQFKADLNVVDPQEQALLLLHKQYCIALSDIDKQAGYPVTIDWPTVPY
ncbi:tail fiber assembly protein [Pseudomonas sp. B33.4]|uniref:tail fiber assembly protein n=1 Tax=Pseudomonas sp. B33.4 TaxID=3104265 RepID=UPI002ADEA84B|nr:tail fiber assembly protein [Pseudomonas sp. B33.4]